MMIPYDFIQTSVTIPHDFLQTTMKNFCMICADNYGEFLYDLCRQLWRFRMTSCRHLWRFCMTSCRHLWRFCMTFVGNLWQLSVFYDIDTKNTYCIIPHKTDSHGHSARNLYRYKISINNIVLLQHILPSLTYDRCDDSVRMIINHSEYPS
jgi:hypothetical protein